MSDETENIFFRLFAEIGILEQLSRALFQARLPPGILVSHFAVVNHLFRVKDGRTPLDLARAFQVAKTTMTHTLSGLEKAGFIEMRPNAEDGRSKRVWITKKGRAFRSNAIRETGPDMASLKLEFAEARIKAILPELEELRKIMDERRNHN